MPNAHENSAKSPRRSTMVGIAVLITVPSTAAMKVDISIALRMIRRRSWCPGACTASAVFIDVDRASAGKAERAYPDCPALRRSGSSVHASVQQPRGDRHRLLGQGCVASRNAVTVAGRHARQAISPCFRGQQRTASEFMLEREFAPGGIEVGTYLTFKRFRVGPEANVDEFGTSRTDVLSSKVPIDPQIVA